MRTNWGLDLPGMCPGPCRLFGQHTHLQAPDAWPVGTAVEKIASVPDDSHQDGARAVVIGSLGPFEGLIGYWVEWADARNIASYVRSDRLRRVAS